MLGVKRSFHTDVRKAGIENFRFHDLRLCAAMNLKRAGVDTLTAMKIVEHKSEKIHKRYNSVSEADLRQAAKRLGFYILTP
jgi:integrase